MIKKTKLALGLMATFGVAALASAPVSADDLSDLNARIAKLESAQAVNALKSDNGNMVFFRGGYARNNNARTDLTFGGGYSVKQDGWDVGAGFDFRLSDDLFGFHDGTEILAELMFTYSQFGTSPTSLANILVPALGAIPAIASQFTLTASPKIKFLKGSKFRPWVIPIGLGINVISPTSNAITYLKPSMQFAAGADYNLWKNIYVGADFRYNVDLGANDKQIDIGGFTTGAYVGIGF